jgi:hypothetical protein
MHHKLTDISNSLSINIRAIAMPAIVSHAALGVQAVNKDTKFFKLSSQYDHSLTPWLYEQI